MFFFKINLENEQELYLRILLKSQFGQMLQICDNGPLRFKSKRFQVGHMKKSNLAVSSEIIRHLKSL